MSADCPLGILDITNEEHHAIRALSNSGMKDLAVSPLRYWYLHLNPEPKPEEEETAALRIGSALHCAVLESAETFDSRYVREIVPEDWPVCLATVGDIKSWVGDKGGKTSGVRKEDVIKSALEYMAKIGEFVPILEEEKKRFFAQNQGKTVLKVDEWERVAGMAKALTDEPALRRILDEGKPEVSMVAQDPDTGVLLKARLDWMNPSPVILDLKSFTARRGVSIDKSVADAIFYERYYIQGFVYAYVHKLVTGKTADFVIAFVESDPPHETRIKLLQPKRGSEPNLYWLQAQLEVRARIRQYAEYMERFGDAPWRDQQGVESLVDDDIRQLSWT